MSEPEPIDAKESDSKLERTRRRVSSSGLVLIFASVASACAAVVIMAPRPVDPGGLPRLKLRPSAVDAAIAADMAAAQDLPEHEDIERAQELTVDYARLELHPEITPDEARRIREQAPRLLTAIQGEFAQAADGLRARATNQAIDALSGRLGDEERRLALGRFPNMLERYDAVDSEGRRRAPEIVIRVLYKSRWNQLFGLEKTAGMSTVEQRAFFGWLLLEARSAPVALRQSALPGFRQSVETDAERLEAEEIEARLLLESGQPELAAERYFRLYEETGNFRLRNHALFAQLQ